MMDTTKAPECCNKPMLAFDYKDGFYHLQCLKCGDIIILDARN